MNSSLKPILIAKCFYWTMHQDPFGWLAKKNFCQLIIRNSEVLLYKLMGKAHSGYCPICEKTLHLSLRPHGCAIIIYVQNVDPSLVSDTSCTSCKHNFSA